MPKTWTVVLCFRDRRPPQRLQVDGYAVSAQSGTICVQLGSGPEAVWRIFDMGDLTTGTEITPDPPEAKEGSH